MRTRGLPTLIVGLTGQDGAGKSTAAQVIASQFYEQPVHFAPFAGPLKNMLRALYEGLPAEFVTRKLYGDLKGTPCPRLNGYTPRHAMRTLGTEWARAHLGPDFWVNIWQRGLPADLSGVVIIADDLRVDNEADCIRGMGGHVIEVCRPDLPQPDKEAHETATGVRADTVILNNGSVNDLDMATLACLDKLTQRNVPSRGVENTRPPDQV